LTIEPTNRWDCFIHKVVSSSRRSKDGSLHRILKIACITAAAALVLGGSAGAVELPPIELPEYIIAGVEQATRITGARIPVGVSARIGVPAESPVSRPKLLTASVWTPPQQPALLLPLGEGSWRSYLGGSGFGKGEAGIELARARSSVSYGAAMGVLKPPNRSGAGAGLDRGIRGLIYGRVGRAGVLAPEIGFGRSSFTLNQAMGGGKRDWTDAYLGFGFSPLSTGAGLLTAGSCLDRGDEISA
jgi:hypothetical protein